MIKINTITEEFVGILIIYEKEAAIETLEFQNTELDKMKIWIQENKGKIKVKDVFKFLKYSDSETAHIYNLLKGD